MEWVDDEDRDEKTTAVAFAVIRPRTLDPRQPVLEDDFSDSLLRAVQPGEPVTRYRKTWRLAKPEHSGDFIFGRIGYEQPGGHVDLWDDDAEDFTTTTMLRGATAPFAIDVRTHVAAFQVRPGNKLRPQAFAGALQALLNQADDQPYHWRVDRIKSALDWESWTDSVEDVVELRLTWNLPNPNWKGRERIQPILEETGASVVRIALQAPDGGQLDINDDLVVQGIRHASQYGDKTAVGHVRVGNLLRRVVWRSKGSEEGVSLTSRAPLDEETGEVPHEQLAMAAEAAWDEVPYFEEEAVAEGADPLNRPHDDEPA